MMKEDVLQHRNRSNNTKSDTGYTFENPERHESLLQLRVGRRWRRHTRRRVHTIVICRWGRHNSPAHPQEHHAVPIFAHILIGRNLLQMRKLLHQGQTPQNVPTLVYLQIIYGHRRETKAGRWRRHHLEVGIKPKQGISPVSMIKTKQHTKKDTVDTALVDWDLLRLDA